MIDTNFKNELLNLLQSTSKESTILAQGTEEFILPGLEIKEIGTIPFPLTHFVAKHIIEYAQKAPYGKGNQTIIDTTVRNTWEIDASQISLKSNQWNKKLEQIVHSLKEQLGISDRKVIPELYKLLLYEPGSFFLKHKDSEKAKGMFGSLVIIFPSQYSGGQFTIEFDGKKETIDVSGQSDKMNWIGFYADCDHEILPVTEGYRLTLIYNLLCNDQEETLAPFQVSKATELALSFFERKEFNTIEKPLGIILKHQYTPTNFSIEQLKGGDHETANILITVANKLGWYANAGLLNHHVIGIPEPGDYYDEDFYDDVMDEVIDNSTSIDNWCIKPSIGELSLESLHMVNDVDFDSVEPFEKNAEGYMGNYGPEVEYWYHYGVVLLAPPKAFKSLLLETTFNEKLEWITYYLDKNSNDWDKALSIYQTINWADHLKENIKTDALFILWAKQPELYLNDSKQQEKFLKSFMLASNESIADMLSQLNKDTVNELMTYCIKTESIRVSEKCSAVIAYLLSTEKYSSTSIQYHLEAPLIEYFSDIIIKFDLSHNDSYKINRREIVKNLILISTIQAIDIDSFVQQITSFLHRKIIYDVFLPVLIHVESFHVLTQHIKSVVLQFLESNTTHRPAAPNDFYRYFPVLEKMDAIDHLLRNFCETKEASTLEFKKAESERLYLIDKVNSYQLDIDHTTIKKGSPYTLLLKKNQNSFLRQLKEFDEDVKSIATLKAL